VIELDAANGTAMQTAGSASSRALAKMGVKQPLTRR
jgi:hypothetical protein